MSKANDILEYRPVLFVKITTLKSVKEIQACVSNMKGVTFQIVTNFNIVYVALQVWILQKLNLEFLVASCLIKFWIGWRYVRAQQQQSIKVPFIDTPITMSNFWQIIWHIMFCRRVCFISKIITFFRKIIFLCFEKVFLRFIIIHQFGC